MLAITETWLSKNGDDATIAEVTPPGHIFQHVARASGRGGGFAIVHRNTYKTKLQPKLSFTTMDLLRLQIINPHCVKYNLWVVYHPPVSSKSSGLISEFYIELEHLFTEVAISVVPTIARDFNVHFDNEAKSEPLRNLLESFNLTQHVLPPTHHSGHILDLMVSSSDNSLISSVTDSPDIVSDHHRIEIAVSTLARPFVVVMTAKRNFRNTDNVALRSEIEYVCVDMTTCGKDQQVEELVATYNNNLTMCFDKLAPWRSVRTRNNIPHSWYDADIADSR